MSERIALNVEAPDFTLPDFRGQPFRLSARRGRHVLLVFDRGFF